MRMRKASIEQPTTDANARIHPTRRRGRGGPVSEILSTAGRADMEADTAGDSIFCSPLRAVESEGLKRVRRSTAGLHAASFRDSATVGALRRG